MATKVYVVDLRKEQSPRQPIILSTFLEGQIREALNKKEQILLFLNKRGYGHHVLCTSCGYSPECPHCSISLSVHHKPRSGNSFLLCHFCGSMHPMLTTCSSCTQTGLKVLGLGTQQVEAEVQSLFPKARVGRMDMDNTGTKEAHHRIYRSMHKGEIDILVGTQMVAKGLDLPQLSLVGVIQADIGLHLPDFRSGERTFQLLTQVIGRSGRRGQESAAIIQTYNPNHPVIQFAARQDYEGFYNHTIEERKQFSYPPYTSCARCTFVHPIQETAYQKAVHQHALITQYITTHHLSIEAHITPALTPKQHNAYHYCIFLKGADLHRLISETIWSTGWRIDMDPLHF